jgi:hypothetical protein
MQLANADVLGCRQGGWGTSGPIRRLGRGGIPKAVSLRRTRGECQLISIKTSENSKPLIVLRDFFEFFSEASVHAGSGAALGRALLRSPDGQIA